MQSLSGAKPATQSALIEEVLGSLAAEVSKAAGLARVAGKAAGMVGASAVMGPWGMALPENEANNIYYQLTTHTHLNQLFAADPFSQSYTYDIQNACAGFPFREVWERERQKGQGRQERQGSENRDGFFGRKGQA